MIPPRPLRALLLTGTLLLGPPLASPPALAAPPGVRPVVGTAEDWVWPLEDADVARRFIAPPHRYGAGHRGVDLRTGGDGTVRSPADGIVAFTGMVAGRPVVTVDHGSGYVSSFEPVTSELSHGTAVGRGDALGSLATGGHAPAGQLHFGVRHDGEYVDPLGLLGAGRRAVLLPCC